MALVDYFLKLDGIDGESADDKHKGEIDVLSWSWGAQQMGTHGTGGGGGAGKVSMHDITIVKKADKSSPKLFLATCNGEHIKSGKMTCRKAGKDALEYMKMNFSDLLVSSYSTAGSGGNDPVPMEHISLNFSKVEIEYTEQSATGSGKGAVKAGWDVKANKAV